MRDPSQPLPQSAALAVRLAHPCFPQPGNKSVKVWRYMNLAKLVSLIESRALYLTRLDKMADPYEGSVTARTVAGINAHLRATGSVNGYPEIGKLFQQGREATFISCWHANEHESEAMWRLYGGSSGGIAVQTTYEKLVDSIKAQPDVYIGHVRYIDYVTGAFPDVNSFTPIMHKRASFSHEREVRLVWYWGNPSPPDTVPESLSIPWDIQLFAEKIFVDPYAPAYYFEAVKAVIKAMAPGLSGRLEWSQMKAMPLF